MHSGEHDNKERWATWSFKMRAYCTAMAPRLGELMGVSKSARSEIRQDAMTLNDAEHSTNLYYILSLLTDGEALDIVQKQSCEHWNGSVASDGDALNQKCPPGSEECYKQSRFPKWDIRGSDVTQLLTALEKASARLRTSER